MNSLFFSFLFAGAVLTNSLPRIVEAAEPGAAPRPHIVYIVADDLGGKDVGFHRSHIKTPNIARLAQEGARLEQLYVPPMCTPTRAPLMTRPYPFPYRFRRP